MKDKETNNRYITDRSILKNHKTTPQFNSV
jgi:hypothetical protein